MERSIFLGVSYASTARGARPQRSPILGFPSIYAHTLWRRTTRFGVVTHMGRELAFRGFDMAHPNGTGSQCSPILGVAFYLCTHPLSQNEVCQTRRGNIYGDGRVLRGQPCHCICTSASRGLSATAEFLVLRTTCRKTSMPAEKLHGDETTVLKQLKRWFLKKIYYQLSTTLGQNKMYSTARASR